MNASPEMKDYFAALEKDCLTAYEIASRAKARGYDAELKPEITLAKNMAERVIGIISVVAPQIMGSGAVERIMELEKQFGVLDWRVALTIAEEVANEKFCRFKDKRESMETGIRAGFTYVTLGVVSSPLEGFTSLEIKNRKDGDEYFCLNYSGPIRNAGGTAASVSVLIGDYIRKKFGYKTYDPDEKEKKRTYSELEDYHEYVTNLQYFPSKEEVEFLMGHLPVEISGDPSEKFEISNVAVKDLPRVPTNRLRSGFCLIHSSCIPLKAPKLWKQIEVWGKDFGLEHWFFLKDFLQVQKKSKAKEKVSEGHGIKPDYTYIKDLVAGRPVLSHPLASGGFRLRYGRSRCSGYSAQSIHPATMRVLDNFIASSTQLKVERPGKAAAFSACDTIDGPIVKLNSGSVLKLNSEKEAIKCKEDIKEILYLGDVLINYGDFLNRAHVLVPPGYCEEYWLRQLEAKAQEKFGRVDAKEIATETNITMSKMQDLLRNPMRTEILSEEALRISKKLGIPLHPSRIFFWKCITSEQFKALLQWLTTARTDDEQKKLILKNSEEKRILELLGVQHLLVNNEFVVIEDEDLKALMLNLNLTDLKDIKENAERIMRLVDENKDGQVLEIINLNSPAEIRDKAGTFIGARMGRPEKAKMRKMTGSPHVLFPVGSEGGRLRSFQSAMEKERVIANFPVHYCAKCNRETVFSVCEICDSKAEKKNFCSQCGLVDACGHEPQPFKKTAIPIKTIFDSLLKKLDTQIYPDLIKGVRGTSNKDHTCEHLIKGILRAKHDLCVNKDGTIRYDCSEMTLTHFKPKEIKVSVEKLKELGYSKDIHGEELVNDDQVLELKVQDVVLPACLESPDEPCDEILYRSTLFIDELLVRLYGLKPYYNLACKEDLLGHYIIGLAPHTSAGILGRIIGFSRTQGFLAHPLFHAAMRRDCDGDESCVLLLMDALLNFSRRYLPSSRGSTMDAPLVLTYYLNPSEVDDMAFDVDVVWHYPLSFYEAAEKYQAPWANKLTTIGALLNTEKQFESMGFTHDTDDFNSGVLCSAYKTLPSMEEKLKGQMALAVKIRAVDEKDVARLVIEKHFIRDAKGNLRKFSQQEFRCVDCNEKFRRPPLTGRCTCGGKIIFTVSEGNILKYVGPSISLAERFGVSVYLKQTLQLMKKRIEGVFGKDAERQEGLGRWFG